MSRLAHGPLPIAVCAVVWLAVAPACRRPTASSTPPSAAAAPSQEIELDYQLQLESPKGFRPFLEEDVFHTGDGFRLVLWSDFAAHVYLLDRSDGETAYHVFASGENGQPAATVRNTRTTLPSTAGKCFRLDDRVGDEDLILVASTAPVSELAGPRTLPRDRADRVLADLLRCCQPPSLRRFVDLDWVKLIAAGRKEMAFVVRLPLRHDARPRQ